MINHYRTTSESCPDRFLTEHPNEPANDEGQPVVDFELEASERVISYTTQSGAYRLHRVD